MRTVEEIDTELRQVGTDITNLRAVRNAALHQADEARRHLLAAHGRLDGLLGERNQASPPVPA